MIKNHEDEDLEEWEFIPDNTSLFQFNLNEIIYTDYFIEQPKLIQKTEEFHHESAQSQFKNINKDQIIETNISKSDSTDTKQSIEKNCVGKKEVFEGVWRWALFSIGTAAAAAAATICVVGLGGVRAGKPGSCRGRPRQRNLVGFFSHEDDKGVSLLVEHASRLNQGLAAARGTPTMMCTAKISFGGSYNSL